MAEINRGPLTTAELQQVNNERLSGVLDEGLEKLKMAQEPSKPNYGYGEKYNSLLSKASMPQTASGVNYSEAAARAGWGQSRYDEANPYLPGQDIEEARAIEQSGFAKIGSGLLKGGVTAGTTAVNTVAGTVFGVGSSLFEAVSRVFGDGTGRPGIGGIIDAGVNNWLSERMMNLQKASEEWFPNYRTEEERSEKYQKEWYRHMGTANFIGDSILKNFGFTVGAMAGGMAWSRVMQKAMFTKMSGDILKGSIAAAEGDAVAYKEMKALADAVRSGNMSLVDPNKLIVSAEAAARQINRADSMLQLFGSAVSAMGEGTSEGLMAKQEFLDDETGKINVYRQRELDAYKKSLLESGDDRIATWIENSDGVGELQLTQYGKRLLNNKKNDLDLKYARLRDQINEESEKLATTTFLLNLPILTTSNLIQFGRMFAGGWNTAKQAASTVSGKINLSAAEKGAEGTARSIGKITSNLTGKGRVAPKSVFNALKVMGSEAFEEMAQGTVSSGAKNVADTRILASYNNDGYDAEAIDSVREWFSAMYQGGEDYLGDIKNWQEGALGALTGLFGIPGKVWQKGNRWNGGIYQAVKDAKAEVKASRDAASVLNNRINKPDFQERWHSYIRHLNYDNKMQDAVIKNDQYAWQNNNDKQLISDVMAFAKAGRLNELMQIVDLYGNMTDADAASLREVLKKSEEYVPTLGNDIRKMSDEEIVSKVRKQADNIKDTVNQYNRVREALAARLPAGVPESIIEELVFTSLQINHLENRFVTMLNETIAEAQPILKMMQYTNDKGENIEGEEAQNLRLEEVKQALESAFSTYALPIKVPTKTFSYAMSQLSRLQNLVNKHGSEELQQKVSDMFKLADDRRTYYEKFETLQTPKGMQKHEEESITDDKVKQKAADEFAKMEASDIASVDQVKQAYRTKDSVEVPQYMSMLKKEGESNPVAKDAYDLLNRFIEFKNFVDQKEYGVGPSSPYRESIPISYAMGYEMMLPVLDGIFDNVTSESELKALKDDVFPSFAEWKGMPAVERVAKNNIFFPITIDTYNATKQIFRNLMADYLNASNTTSTRNINPKPVKQSTKGDAKATGTEPSQPASSTPAPFPPESAPVSQKPAETVPETPPAETESPSESSDNTPMAPPASTEELLSDADDASSKDELFQGEDDLMKETASQTESGDNFRKKPFYHLGTPEIASSQNAKARKGGQDRKTADLSDFVIEQDPDKNKGFRPVWLKLDSMHGFQNTSEEANVGDELEFIRYQNEDGEFGFPRVGNREQIVIRLKKNGHVLNTLVEDARSWYNLGQFKEAFEKEYRDWLDTNPASTEVFVFSKTSKIWLKQPGQIDYDYAVIPDGFVKEQSVTEKPGYDENAPIVFISRNGTPVVIKGDKSAARNFRINNSLMQRRGALYYMAKDGDNSYIPIRLFVEHFRPESVEKDLPIINSIKDSIKKIANIVKSTSNTVSGLTNGREEMHSELATLASMLDCNNLIFDIESISGQGISLKITDRTGRYDDVIIPASDMTDESLINTIANYGMSLQIREGLAETHYQNLLDSGAITTNANKLWAKGVDLYFDAWDGEKFAPITQKQKDAVAKREEAMAKDKENRKEAELPVSPEPEPVSSPTEGEPSIDDMEEGTYGDGSVSLEGFNFKFRSDDDEFAGIKKGGTTPSNPSPVKAEPIAKRTARDATDSERKEINSKLNASLYEALKVGATVDKAGKESMKEAAGQLMLLSLTEQESLRSGFFSESVIERWNAAWNIARHFSNIDGFNLNEHTDALNGKAENILEFYRWYDDPGTSTAEGTSQEVNDAIWKIASRMIMIDERVFDVAYKMRIELNNMGFESDSFTEKDIDFSKFENLPTYIQEALRLKVSPEEYNKLSRRDQEDMLRCSSV